MIIDAIRRWMGSPPGGGENGGSGDGDPDMIPCEEALARVYEYLDGELGDASREEVELHFRVCTRCYPHLKLEQSFRDALQRAAEGQAAPPDLRARVIALVEGDERAE